MLLQTLAVYLLKTIIISALLLLYYWLALRNKKLHYYNRFYLLASVLLSITLPFINLPLFTVSSNSDRAIKVFDVIYAGGEESAIATSSGAAINWQQVLLMITFAVTGVLLLMLAARIVTIYKTKQKYPVTNMQEFDFVNTDLRQAPFSFLKNVFWRNDISLEENTGRLILQHELTHIKEKHTLDRIFLQIVAAVLWANPLYRLYQKELYLVHEFIADDKSVTDSDAAAFAEMLLHAHYGKFNFDPAQPFFYSPIKRRLLMLTTSKEPGFSYLRRIMVLPLLACTVLLFAFRLHKDNDETPVIKVDNKENFKVVIDAGHGGEDNGALAADGTKEKDINLTVAKKIQTLAAAYGIEVIMTRTADVYMTPKQKADFANSQHAGAFISIHANAATKEQPARSGVEVIVAKNNDNRQLDKSKILGSALLQQLAGNFTAPQTLLQRPVGIWVLQATNVPAALIECGYLTDKKDLGILKDDAQVETLARKILEGIAAYANNEEQHISPADVQMQTSAAVADTNKPKVEKVTIVNVPANVVYIVDGKKSTKETVDKLTEIKSVNVLKGATWENSKYYVKGKSGAVVVTTRADDENSSVFINTPGKDAPVYIIDGKIVESAELQVAIERNDILSLNVLKGEAAIKKYGDKGKNGAIEVTSKNKDDKDGEGKATFFAPPVITKDSAQ